jgi:hypothetical protein
MEQDHKKPKNCQDDFEYLEHSSLCNLPRDVIKVIISYCPCGQWFSLSKQLHILAVQVISPLDHFRKTKLDFPPSFGALGWSGTRSNSFNIQHNLTIFSLQ